MKGDGVKLLTRGKPPNTVATVAMATDPSCALKPQKPLKKS